MQAPWGAVVRLGSVIAAVFVLLASILVLPAFGQDPYPPPPPPPPPSPAEVECDLESAGRTITCDGDGFEAGSTVTLELRRTGPPTSASGVGNLPLATIHGVAILAQQGNGNVVASGQSEVEDDGTFEVSADLPCDYDSDRVLAQVRGTDANGDNATFSEMLDVSDADPCALPRSDENVLDSDEARPGDDAGILPITGVQLLILIVVALALIAGGTLLVRHRRNQHTAT